MTRKLAGYVVEVFGQEEDGDLTQQELEIQLHPHELEIAIAEYLSGQLDREVFSKVSPIIEDIVPA
jgi:hypothetical protein